MTYTKITKSQFDEMQFNAGVIVRSFSIQNPAIQDEDIVCATTGGFSLAVEPSYVDLGDGVYMMQPGTAEMMMLTGWSVEASFTCISMSASSIRMVLGPAEDSADNGIVPKMELQDADYNNLYWIGDRIDGGMVVVKLINALSDEGISIKTAPKSMGEVEVHLTCHASIEEDMEAVPVEIYSVEGKPFFDVVQHKFLFAYNVDDFETFDIDEDTGHLIISSDTEYQYEVNTQTGHMEVSRN